MSAETLILMGTVAAVAFVHTISGPDHYLPFVALARARRWSLRRVATVTLVCGTGHVAGSIVLGLTGLALGYSLESLELFESLSGRLAAWLLIAFGSVYLAWGLRRALQGRTHEHWHTHDTLGGHRHAHSHASDHLHLHEAPGRAESQTGRGTWALFTIFLLGPCEPLIPLMLYTGAAGAPWSLLAVCVCFSVVTLATMLAAVLLATAGLGRMEFPGLARFGHALAGGVILACGIAVVFVGL